MSIEAKTSSILKKVSSDFEHKVVWHTIDSMSNSAPGWSIVVSIIIFFAAGLFALMGFSGSSGTNLILFISALLILGGGAVDMGCSKCWQILCEYETLCKNSKIDAFAGYFS